MALKSPQNLAGLISLPSRALDETNVLQYDARQRCTLSDPALYPTPRGFQNFKFHDLLENEDRYGYQRPIAMDVLCLRFKSGQVEQFRDCEHPPIFERLRSATAVSFNLWRKSIVLRDGCEQIRWGICDDSAPDTIILLICTCPRVLMTVQSADQGIRLE